MMLAYVLREVMLCFRKFVVGGHVSVECMSSGYFTICCVLFEETSFWRTCLI